MTFSQALCFGFFFFCNFKSLHDFFREFLHGIGFNHGDATAVSASHDKQKVAWLDVEFLAGFSRDDHLSSIAYFYGSLDACIFSLNHATHFSYISNQYENVFKNYPKSPIKYTRNRLDFFNFGFGF
jgi:hypothetical protein